jgi:hypothetical protein
MEDPTSHFCKLITIDAQLKSPQIKNDCSFNITQQDLGMIALKIPFTCPLLAILLVRILWKLLQATCINPSRHMINNPIIKILRQWNK